MLQVERRINLEKLGRVGLFALKQMYLLLISIKAVAKWSTTAMQGQHINEILGLEIQSVT